MVNADDIKQEINKNRREYRVLTEAEKEKARVRSRKYWTANQEKIKEKKEKLSRRKKYIKEYYKTHQLVVTQALEKKKEEKFSNIKNNIKNIIKLNPNTTRKSIIDAARISGSSFYKYDLHKFLKEEKLKLRG